MIPSPHQSRPAGDPRRSARRLAVVFVLLLAAAGSSVYFGAFGFRGNSGKKSAGADAARNAPSTVITQPLDQKAENAETEVEKNDNSASSEDLLAVVKAGPPPVVELTPFYLEKLIPEVRRRRRAKTPGIIPGSGAPDDFYEEPRLADIRSLFLKRLATMSEEDLDAAARDATVPGDTKIYSSTWWKEQRVRAGRAYRFTGAVWTFEQMAVDPLIADDGTHITSFYRTYLTIPYQGVNRRVVADFLEPPQGLGRSDWVTFTGVFFKFLACPGVRGYRETPRFPCIIGKRLVKTETPEFRLEKTALREAARDIREITGLGEQIFSSAANNYFLNAVRLSKPGDMQRLMSKENLTFQDFLLRPSQLRGTAKRWKGAFAQARKVLLPPNQIGLESYWQGQLQVEGALSFITVHFLEPPPKGLKKYETRVIFEGVFLQVWKYESRSPDRRTKWVSSPLFVGRMLELAPPPEPDYAGMILGSALIGAMIIGVLLLVWKSARDQRESDDFMRQVSSRRRAKQRERKERAGLPDAPPPAPPEDHADSSGAAETPGDPGPPGS